MGLRWQLLWEIAVVWRAISQGSFFLTHILGVTTMQSAEPLDIFNVEHPNWLLDLSFSQSEPWPPAGSYTGLRPRRPWWVQGVQALDYTHDLVGFWTRLRRARLRNRFVTMQQRCNRLLLFLRPALQILLLGVKLLRGEG